MDTSQVWNKLYAEKQAFLDDLRPKYITPSLLKYRVITKEEEEDILKLEDLKEQVNLLFTILQTKSPQLFKYFKKSLYEDLDGCATYPWLATKLEPFNTLTQKSNSILVNGSIPFQVNHRFLREDKLLKIRHELTEVRSSLRHWVVLFGPLGSGKTVLAAESLRCNDLIEKHFPGGIYFIHIGDAEDDDALMLKLNRLLKLMNLDDNISPSQTLNDLTLILRQEVCKKPKFLLVLDDVWKERAIKVFDIGCPILVTTKHKKAIEKVSAYCTEIECKDDWSVEEIKELLASYAKCKVNNLPDVVDEVCKKCKGSPLVASLIGGKMADFGTNQKHWKSFNDILEKRGFRYVSKNYKDLSRIVNLCLEPIKDYREFYLDFLIFFKDIPVPNKLLQLLWDKEEYEVHEIMFELNKRCFVQIEKSEEGDDSCSYTSHNLYLDTLKADLENSDLEIKNRHKKLVSKLQKNGRIDLSCLPKEYIPFTIAYHLFEADEWEMLRDLYLDLQFVELKIQLNQGAVDILYDYKLYRCCFKEEDNVENYESFLYKNSLDLSQRKSDIIQLALFEPSTSSIYKAAKDIATKSVGRIYYDWCNKDETDPQLFNYFKCSNFRKGKYAVINNDASRVALFDETLGTTWEVRTINGERLQDLWGHSGLVNHCSFNSVGNKLVTASEDTTVKVYNIAESLTSSGNYSNYSGKRLSSPSINLYADRRDNSMLTFRDHADPVVCCDFSPDDEYIISCDMLKTYVWQINGQGWIIKHQKQPPNEKVAFTFCCFSSEGGMFAASAGDAIQIWNSCGKEKWTLYHDDILVTKFCFSIDDRYLMSITDNVINKWDMESGQKVEVISTGPNNDIVLCSICLNSEFIACGTSQGSVIVVNNRERHDIVAILRGHNHDVVNVMFSRDNKKLFSMSSSSYICHDMSEVRDSTFVSFEGILSAGIVGDLVVATSNYFDCVEIRKGLEGKLLTSSKPEKKKITACSWSNDCSVIVYGTKSGHVKVFDITEKHTTELEKHMKQVNYILHSKQDSIFFTCSEDKTIRIWKNFKIHVILRGHADSVLMCVEFKKCNQLLSCSKDGSLRIWNSNTGECILPITEGHGNQDVRYCDISPREDCLASASADETIKVWNSYSGELLKCFQLKDDPNSSVMCCRFSPSSEILISGHDNGKVVMWHLRGNQSVQILSQHDSKVHDIRFSTDKLVHFLSLSCSIKLWSPTAQLVQRILLPSSYAGSDPPCLWTSNDFRILVVVINSVLYILKRIVPLSVESLSLDEER